MTHVDFVGEQRSQMETAAGLSRSVHLSNLLLRAIWDDMAGDDRMAGSAAAYHTDLCAGVRADPFPDVIELQRHFGSTVLIVGDVR